MNFISLLLILNIFFIVNSTEARETNSIPLVYLIESDLIIEWNKNIKVIENIGSLYEVPCFTGTLEVKKNSPFLGASYSRHLYLYLTRQGDVFGVKLNGLIEKEEGSNWESLNKFIEVQAVCDKLI